MPAKLFSKNTNFNPILITSQIFLVISIYYILLIFFTIVYNTLFNLKLHIDQILSGDAFDFQNSYGYCTFLANLSTHVILTFVFIMVIEKANKILDYALTTFFIQLILTTLNSQFPLNFFWWIFNVALFALTTLVSEYISIRLDQKNIALDLKVSDKV
jgi:hypothetical protein